MKVLQATEQTMLTEALQCVLKGLLKSEIKLCLKEDLKAIVPIMQITFRVKGKEIPNLGRKGSLKLEETSSKEQRVM